MIKINKKILLSSPKGTLVPNRQYDYNHGYGCGDWGIAVGNLGGRVEGE